MNNIIKYMEGDFVMDRLTPVLGSEREAKSYVASAMIAVNDSADLMACSPDSIFQAVMRAAILKLRVDKSIGEAWIIARRNNKKGVKEATFQIGWPGWYMMAMKTREYRRIDIMKIEDGVKITKDFATSNPKYEFDRESKGGWFAIFEMTNGYTKWIYWDADKMHAHYLKYAPKNPMWKSSYDKMAEKTIGTHLMKKWGVFDEKDRKVLNTLGDDGEMEDLPELESGFEDVVDGQIEEPEEKEDPLVELGIQDPPKKTQTERPHAPEYLRSFILDAANKRGVVPDSEIVGTNQNGKYDKRGILAGIYSRTLGDNLKRHETLEYMFGAGKRSTKDLSNAQVLELLAHHSSHTEHAEIEIKAMYAQSQKDKGQGELA